MTKCSISLILGSLNTARSEPAGMLLSGKECAHCARVGKRMVLSARRTAAPVAIASVQVGAGCGPQAKQAGWTARFWHCGQPGWVARPRAAGNLDGWRAPALLPASLGGVPGHGGQPGCAARPRHSAEPGAATGPRGGQPDWAACPRYGGETGWEARTNAAGSFVVRARLRRPRCGGSLGALRQRPNEDATGGGCGHCAAGQSGRGCRQQLVGRTSEGEGSP